jgi:hypothetical protein
LFSYSINAQLQDANAFFNGTYDKNLFRKERVKQVIVENFAEGTKSSYAIYKFNRQGFLKKLTTLDTVRKKTAVFIFKYNKYGDQVERTNIDYRLSKTYKATFQRIYHGNKLVSEKSSELPFWVKKYSYNLTGQLSEMATIMVTDTTNSLSRISKYYYDSTGKLQTIKVFLGNVDTPRNILDTTSFLYDKNGRIVSVLRHEGATYHVIYRIDGLIQFKTTKMPEEFGNIELTEKYRYLIRK